ncbi:MAG: hypothetical protein QOG54_956 [Actinomycetota bacterium]|nr:hypothetical protein [Actinomycetota bacterium]
MALAAPVLVPIHWFLARSASSGWTRGGWIFLAVFSIWEAAWIYAYVLVQNETIAVFTGLAISLFGAMAFVATTGVHETAPPTIGSTS